MILESVKVIEELESYQVLKLSFTNREAFMIGNISEVTPYLGEEVAVDFDVATYKGAVADFVYTIARVSQVKELLSVDSPKLYTEFTDNSSTVNFSDIDNNSIIPSATVYCLSQTMRSSIKAVWGELTVRDMKGRVASVRMFGISEFEYDYTNSYVRLNLHKSPTYGFSTDSISVAQGIAKENPEVMIAYDYVKKSITGNDTLRKVLEETSLLERIKEYNNIEVGFELMLMASELEFLKSACNITPNLNYELLQSAIILSRAYVTSLERVYYSKRDRTTFYIAALQASSEWKKKVIGIINGTDEEIQPLDHTIFNAIKEMAKITIDIRRSY